MNKIVNGILAVIAGIASIIYFLLQTGTIVIHSMVVDYHYTSAFETLMDLLGIVLVVIYLIVIIVNFQYMKKCGKTARLGCYFSVLLSALNAVCIILMGMITVFTPLILVGGILILVSKS